MPDAQMISLPRTFAETSGGEGMPVLSDEARIASEKARMQKLEEDLMLIASLIPREYLAAEPELMIAAWPEYRFTGLLARTRSFFEAYKTAHRDHVRETIDLDMAKNSMVGKYLNLAYPNFRLTQVWIARQHADLMGIPYEEYLEFVFSFARARTRNKPPQPNQLRPNNRQSIAWAARFAQYWDTNRYAISLYRMKHLPQYADSRMSALPAIHAFRNQLLELCDHPEIDIASFAGSFILKHRYLTASQCKGRLDPDQVDRAIDCASSDPLGSYAAVEADAPPAVDFLQSCYGLAGIDKSIWPCTSCLLRDRCERLAAEVTAELKRETGSADPLRSRSKEQDRLRSKKYRDRRKRAAAEQSIPVFASE